MKSDPTEITGLTLIDKVLEFVRMTPDSSTWTFQKLSDNSPRFIRFQQINFLLKLFTPETFNSNDIKSSIESVLNGDFILQRDIQLYKQVFKNMDSLIIQSKPNSKIDYQWTAGNLKFNYEEIISYKEKLNGLLEFNSGIMEISYPYFYSYILTKEISENINFKKLDNFLLSVVDPAKRTFKKIQLIKSYNYPKEDVFDIDIDDL